METGPVTQFSDQPRITFPFRQSLSPQSVSYPAFTLPSVWPACSLPLFLSCAGERHSTRPRSVWLDHLPRLAELAEGFVCYLLSRFHHRLWNKTETRLRCKGGGQTAAAVRPGADCGWKAALRCKHTPPLLFDQILLKSSSVLPPPNKPDRRPPPFHHRHIS